jgi:hypothetical protein
MRQDDPKLIEARAELERRRKVSDDLAARLTAGENVRSELNAAIRRVEEIYVVLRSLEGERPAVMYGPPVGIRRPSGGPSLGPVKKGGFFSRFFGRK